MITFKELIIKNLSHLTVAELIEVNKEITNIIGGEDLAKTALQIKQSQSLLQSVKYVKEITGWGLRESKEYCDNLK